ncbi:MAG: lasso peptide biosynthesis B2 protein [Sphingomicrobium sp.]
MTRWIRIGRERQWLFIEAVAALAAASAAIQLLPFRRAIRLGSRPLETSSAKDSRIQGEVCWAVEAAARRAPWRAVCIQKGLAAQWMLRRRGVDAVLHYGIAREEAGELQAHVWVAAGDEIVVGGDEAPKFKCVAKFS